MYEYAHENWVMEFQIVPFFSYKPRSNVVHALSLNISRRQTLHAYFDLLWNVFFKKQKQKRKNFLEWPQTATLLTSHCLRLCCRPPRRRICDENSLERAIAMLWVSPSLLGEGGELQSNLSIVRGMRKKGKMDSL